MKKLLLTILLSTAIISPIYSQQQQNRPKPPSPPPVEKPKPQPESRPPSRPVNENKPPSRPQNEGRPSQSQGQRPSDNQKQSSDRRNNGQNQQHVTRHPDQHEPRHEGTREPREKFSRSAEFKNFHFSRESIDNRNHIRMFFRLHREYEHFWHNDFINFDCTWYQPIWDFELYPDYYSIGLGFCVWPTEHIVYYTVPDFRNITSVDQIDPDSVIVFEGNGWIYTRNWYTIHLNPQF